MLFNNLFNKWLNYKNKKILNNYIINKLLLDFETVDFITLSISIYLAVKIKLKKKPL